MKWLVIFCFAIPVSGYAQLVKIREIKRRPAPRYFNTTDSTIIYPVVVTGNRNVDSAINERVRSVLEFDQPGMSLSRGIQATIRNGLTGLWYEVTFSNRSLLSVHISIEWSGGAYPTYSDTYFSFDLLNGDELTINDLFDREQLEKIRLLVSEAKIKFLTAYRTAQLDSLRAGRLDSDTYQLMMTSVNNDCMDSASVEVFSLLKSGVEFIDPCKFPHIIAGLKPDYSLKYTYSELGSYFKPEFMKRVLRR